MYSKDQSELRLYVPRPSAKPLGMGLLRPAWVQFNCFRNGVEKFQSSTHKWELACTSICKCGALAQTVSHLILECPLHCDPRGHRGLSFWMMRLNAGTTK